MTRSGAPANSLTPAEGNASASHSRPLVDWGWLLACVLAVGLFYAPLLQPGVLQAHGDLANLFVPAHVHAARAWHQGVWPLWNPHQFMGTPFLAALQAGVLYPPHWPVRWLAASPAHAPLAIHLSLHAHLLWLAAGLFVLVRRLCLPPPAAAFFALAVSCGAFTSLHLPHFNQILTLAWVPWVLLTGMEWLRGGRVPWLLSATACMAMGVLVGHPQNLVLALLLLAFVVPLWLPVRAPGLRGLAGGVAQGFGRGLIWGGLTALICAAQILPTFELSKQAWIIGEGPGYAASIALPPIKFIELLVPNHLGSHLHGYAPETDGWMHEEMGMFAGRITLLLSVGGLLWGLAALRRRAASGPLSPVRGAPAVAPWVAASSVALCAGVMAFSALMAVGQATPLFDAVLSVVPPLSKFRAPARYLLLFHLSLAMLAALALTILLAHLRPGGVRTAVAVVLPAVLWFELHAASHPQAFRHMPPVAGPPTSGEVWRALEATGAVQPDAPTPSPARIFWMIREDHYHRKSFDAHLVRAGQFNPNNNLLWGLPMVQGYGESLLPTLRFRDFLQTWHRSFFQAQPDVAMLEAMNVRYVLSDQPFAETPGIIGRAVQQRPGALPPLFLYELPQALPAVFPEAALPYEDMMHMFDGLWRYNGRPIGGMNRKLQAWHEWLTPRPADDVAEARAAARREVQVGLLSFNQRLIELRAPQQQLVVSQGAYPGWVLRRLPGGASTSTWGEPVGHLRGTSAMLLTTPPDLPEGLYRLSFEPASFRLGVLLTALGLSLASALLAAHIRRGRAGHGRHRPSTISLRHEKTASGAGPEAVMR